MNLPSAISFGAFLKLILLDLTMGVNNAVLIVPTFLSIPTVFRRQAIVLGTVGAIVLRAGMLLVASVLAGIPGVCLLAGLWVAASGYWMLSRRTTEQPRIAPKGSLFLAATAIAVADMTMSVDNVFALAATAHRQGHIAYAMAAVCISIPVIMFGSELLARVLHRLPVLGWCGGALLGFVGATIALADPLLARYTQPDTASNLFFASAPWVSALAVVSLALCARNRGTALRLDAGAPQR